MTRAVDRILAGIPSHRGRSRRQAIHDYGPSDALKPGTRVKENRQGAETEVVAEQRGTTVYFKSGGHAHITKLVAADTRDADVDLKKLSEEMLIKLSATIARTIREKNYKDVGEDVRQMAEINAELKRRGASDDYRHRDSAHRAMDAILAGIPRWEPPRRRRMGHRDAGARVVYNRLLGGWYVVTGPHQAPLNGRFESKEEAQAWLARRGSGRDARATIARRHGHTTDESAATKARNEGRLSERERAAASSHVEHRADMPDGAFLEPSQKKYPVKEKRGGEWKYDRGLLLATARRARMEGDESLAKRADAIREREFGGAGDADPNRITTVYSVGGGTTRGGTMRAKTSSGKIYILSPAATGGKIPRVGSLLDPSAHREVGTSSDALDRALSLIPDHRRPARRAADRLRGRVGLTASNDASYLVTAEFADGTTFRQIYEDQAEAEAKCAELDADPSTLEAACAEYEGEPGEDADVYARGGLDAVKRRARDAVRGIPDRRRGQDAGPGIYYVSWKNESGEVKKIRVAAENEEFAIKQSKKQLRGSGWTVLRVDWP